MVSQKGVSQPFYIRPILISAVLVASVFFYYKLTWGSMENFVVAMDHCKDLFCDFTKQYYPTGQELFVSATPTNGYFYSSFFAIGMAGLAKLNMETAVALWGFFQLLTTSLLCLIPARYFFEKSNKWGYVYLVMVLTAVPVLHNFKWGQISVLITVCVLGAWYYYENGRNLPAALLLALAISMKYYAGIFLFLFLLKREWRLLFICATTIITLVVIIPLLALGLENNLHFYQVIAGRIEHARTTWMLTDINTQYFPSVVGRWFELFSAVPPSRLLVQWVGYAVAGFNLLWIGWLVWQKTADHTLWAFVLLFLTLPFLVETSWPHYFVYLPFCQLIILQKGHGKLIQLLIFLSIYLASIFCFNLFPAWTVYSNYGLLFSANLLTLFACTWHLRPANHSLTIDP